MLKNQEIRSPFIYLFAKGLRRNRSIRIVVPFRSVVLRSETVTISFLVLSHKSDSIIIELSRSVTKRRRNVVNPSKIPVNVKRIYLWFSLLNLSGSGVSVIYRLILILTC